MMDVNSISPVSSLITKEMDQINKRNDTECNVVVNTISSIITDAEEDQFRKDIECINLELENVRSKARTYVPGVNLIEPLNIKELKSIKSDDIATTQSNVQLLGDGLRSVLKRMEKHLHDMLNENRKKQNNIISIIEHKREMEFKISNRYRIRCAGMPYFKDHYGFHQPNNEDVRLKLARKQLLPTVLIQGTHIWTFNDVHLLKEGVLKSLIQMKVKELQRNRRELKYDECKTLIGEIRDVECWTLAEAVRNSNLDLIDWSKISVVDMASKFSETECEAMWKLNVSPNINNSPFKPQEFKKLTEIAQNHNYQDWDQIATDLGTNRTGYRCCVQFYNKNAVKEGKWTPEEDEKLKGIVELAAAEGSISWSKVSWQMEKRTNKQCFERYAYHLKDDIKKGQFNVNEDSVILQGVNKFGTNFHIISKFLPGRVPPQIRSRYEHLVAMVMPSFSQKEDELLVSLVKQYSQNWQKISEFCGQRTALQCRKRWTQLKRKSSFLSLWNSCGSYSPEGSTVEVRSDAGNSSRTDDTTESHLSEILKDEVNKQLSRQNWKKPTRSVKTLFQSEALSNLMTYLSSCYGYSSAARYFYTSDQFKNMCFKMRLALASLSAETDLRRKMPVIEANKRYLDFEDVRVLTAIQDSYHLQSDNVDFKVTAYNCYNLNNALIPPNYTTLVGLRTLLLARNTLCKFSETFDSNSKSKNSAGPNDKRLTFTDAKKLWCRRLKSLFALPFVLSQKKQEEERKIALEKSKPKRKSKKQKRMHGLLLNRARYLKRKGINMSKEEILASVESNKFKAINVSRMPGPNRGCRGRPRKNVIRESSEKTGNKIGETKAVKQKGRRKKYNV